MFFSRILYINIHILSHTTALKFLYCKWCKVSQAGQAPHYLAEDIHLVAAGPGRQLRSSMDRLCSVPRTYSTSGDRSFAAVGTRVWNSLPSNLRDEKLSYRSFRCLLKTHWFTADHSAMWTIICCAIEIHLLTYLLDSNKCFLFVDIYISKTQTIS